MKTSRAILLAAGLMIVLVILSACTGSYPLSPGEIGEILLGQAGETMGARVFWQLRLPRVFMGLLAGGVLSLAGAVYQIIFRNPLASPDLTGVASGASFGAACAIVLGSGSGYQIMLGSFTMGMAALGLMLLMVRTARLQQLSGYILAGVIVSSLADAGLMCLKIMADPERELAAIEFWTMGSLGSFTAEKLLPQTLFMVIPAGLLLLFHRQILMLSLGADHARSMGLDPGRWRAALLALTTLMVAALVSVTGVIAFVGLIGPHIAFLLCGRRGRGYLWLSALLGADLLLIADVLARTLWKGAELPLSVLTVFLAIPVLAALLHKREGGSHGVF